MVLKAMAMRTEMIVTIALAGALLSAAPAMAQEETAPAEPAEAPVVEEAPVADPEEDEALDVDDDPTALVDDQVDDDGVPVADENLDPADKLYWANLRDVYTMQKRAFQKDGRFAVTVYGGVIPNNIFERYYPVGVRLNYFILENLGLELAGSYAFSADTGLQETLQEEQGIGVTSVLLSDTQVSHTNFGVVWSPFYGKTAFYVDALNYFDLYLFAGVGLVITESIPEANSEPERALQPEGALGAGLAYYLGEHLSLRFDFRQFVYQDDVGGTANPSEASLGLGWFF